jgi:predicted HTH domain antitoxin
MMYHNGWLNFWITGHKAQPVKSTPHQLGQKFSYTNVCSYYIFVSSKMRVIHLNIPDNVNLKDHELSMMLAAKLYEDAVLSAGQAAQIVGLSKKAFIEMLGKYGVSVFSDSISELKADISNA